MEQDENEKVELEETNEEGVEAEADTQADTTDENADDIDWKSQALKYKSMAARYKSKLPEKQEEKPAQKDLTTNRVGTAPVLDEA